MRLQDHIDFTTLQWVKPELDETLSAAREALEAYVEQPENAGAMRSCAEHLHQAHGTLQILELYGAATVAAEMGALAGELIAGGIAEREEAYTVMMRGLMQLPDYLERLSGGHRDVPVVLLPLLNDLRASRQLPPLPESALFHPNLDAFLPEQAPAALSDLQAQALSRRAGGLASAFPTAIAWLVSRAGCSAAIAQHAQDAVGDHCALLSRSWPPPVVDCRRRARRA